MRESCSYGSVGERGGNEPLYLESLLSAYLNNEVMVWNRKYKALAALNSFLLLAISFNTKTSFPERESHPIILEMSFFFQLDKVLLGIVVLSHLHEKW
jgi:hypothetical protein